LAFKVSINSGSNHPISIALAEPWSIIGKLENDNFSMHPHTGTDIQTDGLRLFYQLDTVNVCGGEAVAQLQESASKQNIDGAIGIFLQWAGNAETGDPWGAKISAFPRKTEILRKGYLIADSQTLPTILKEQKIIMHHPENKDILHITYTPGLPNVEVTFYPNYRWQEGSPGVLISDEALETQKINVLPYLTKLTALEKQKHYLSLGFVLGEPVYTPPPATAPVVPTESGEETSFVSVLSKAIRAKSKNK
jgi:hypothetical protein